MKKTVLHVIESLTRGGAEVLLTEALKDISDNYRHVLVYLRPPTTLLPEVKADKIYCLNYKGKRNILLCIYRFQRIIKQENVNLIHAHHYWPTIIARMAKPGHVPLLFTVHSPLSHDAFQANRLSLYLERLTYKGEHHPIFVSKTVADDYFRYIKVKGKSSVLYNFVATEFYDPRHTKSVDVTPKGALRMVAVGNLRAAKNYYFVLDVFSLLKEEEIYLDIFGDGPLRDELRQTIEENGLGKVKLRGTTERVVELLRHYDAFILASTYEGMSLAVIEAMAVGLPCVLSDIPSNREVADDVAVFFNLSSAEDAADKLTGLLRHPDLLRKMSAASKTKALNFQKERYLKELEDLYKLYL